MLFEQMCVVLHLEHFQSSLKQQRHMLLLP
jgi:hypothetical protein